MRQGGTNAAWRKTRGVVFRTMGDVCVKCGDKATEVDHIIELANGGTDDLENLQPLCTNCHKAKTAAFNSQRLTKKKNKLNNSINDGFFWSASPPTTLSLSYLSPSLTIEPPINQKKEKASNDAGN